MKTRFQLSILADGGSLSVGSDATVTLRLPGTATAATIYSNSTGATTTTNPLSADSNGNVACYVTPGRYDLVITTSDGTVTLTDYEISGVGIDVSAQAGASYPTVAGDNGRAFTFAQAGNATVTLLASAPVGYMVHAVNTGGGAVVFAFGTDTEANGNTTGAAGKLTAAVKIASTIWLLVGDVS
jgi:hypothetical protein